MSNIKLFESRKIRSTWNEAEQKWFFSVADVVEALTDTVNVRDHMTDLELIFSMLGEASTTEIARNKDAQGFQQNKVASKEGGQIAGDARKALEKKSGRKVVSKQNYKELPPKEARKLSARERESE